MYYCVPTDFDERILAGDVLEIEAGELIPGGVGLYISEDRLYLSSTPTSDELIGRVSRLLIRY